MEVKGKASSTEKHRLSILWVTKSQLAKRCLYAYTAEYMVNQSGFPPTRVRINDCYAVYWRTEHYSKNEHLKIRINITLKLQSKRTEF